MCSSNEGTEFVVIFLKCKLGEPLYLYMTTSLSVPVNVSITTPTWNSTDAVDKVVTVINNDVTSVDLPDSLKLSGTKKDSKVVHVVAEGSIVLYGGNQARLSGDSYLVYPITSLGRRYTVATFESDNNQKPALGIAAIADDTEISINFTTNATITFEGTNYTSAMTTNLQKFEVVHISKDHETLNGATVYSNKDILVNSGHYFLKMSYPKIASTASADHVEEQLLSTNYWSTEYVVTSSQYQDNLGDIARLYSGDDDTTIAVDNGNMSIVYISTAGNHYDIQMRGAPLYLKADKPFQVAQFGLSTGIDIIGDPYLIMPPATTQYKHEYTFLTPSIRAWSDFTIYLSLIANIQAKEDISFDGAQLALIWEQVGQSEYYYARFNISEGVHHVRTTVFGGVLGGMLYGLANKDQYGTSIGKYLPKNNYNYRVR